MTSKKADRKMCYGIRCIMESKVAAASQKKIRPALRGVKKEMTVNTQNRLR